MMATLETHLRPQCIEPASVVHAATYTVASADLVVDLFLLRGTGPNGQNNADWDES